VGGGCLGGGRRGLFLAADSARYITGSEVKLDGRPLATRDLPDIPSAFAPVEPS